MTGAQEGDPRRGAVLAVDLGDARIGVAVSDPDRRVAVPVGTIRTGPPQDIKAVAALVREHAASTVVVGHPVLLSGEPGTRARHAEAFAAALRSLMPETEVVLHDERLSTVQAEGALRDAGVRGRRRRAAVDQTAATVILQSYLDASRRG